MSFSQKLKAGPFGALYEEAKLPKDIRRSLNFIALGNILGTSYGVICGSGTTAMVGLATSLGANDLAFGIINAIFQAAAFMQIPFSMLVNRTHKRKQYILTVGVLSRVLWILFGFIPFIIPQAIPGIQINLRLWSLIFLLGISSVSGAMINVCWFPWLSDLAPLTIRGRWLSIREVFLAIASIVVGFISARLLDTLPETSRYIVLFIIGGSLGIADMLCFAPAKEVYSAPPQTMNLKGVLSEIVHNKPFFRFMIMWTMWCFTWNMAAVYFTPYSMNYMGLTATQIMIFGTIAASVSTILIVPRWGRAQFRFGGKSVMLVGCIGASLSQLAFLFATPKNPIPMLVFNLVGAFFWSGCNLAANSFQLSTSSDESRPSYIAVFSCVTALVGNTLGSLAGGWLLDWWDSANMFTGWFDRYKMLFVIAFVLRMTGILLLVPRMTNDNDKTALDLIKSILRLDRRR